MLLPCRLSIRRLTERWAAAALSLNASISLSPFRSHRPRNGGSIRHDPRTHTVLHYPSSQPTAFGSRLPGPVQSLRVRGAHVCMRAEVTRVRAYGGERFRRPEQGQCVISSFTTPTHTNTERERQWGRERERVLSERSIGHFRGFCF